MTGIFRRELLDVTPGEPDRSLGYPGRHVIQQKPGEPREFFYIEREGGMKLTPRMTNRVARWHGETLASLTGQDADG